MSRPQGSPTVVPVGTEKSCGWAPPDQRGGFMEFWDCAQGAFIILAKQVEFRYCPCCGKCVSAAEVVRR